MINTTDESYQKRNYTPSEIISKSQQMHRNKLDRLDKCNNVPDNNNEGGVPLAARDAACVIGFRTIDHK